MASGDTKTESYLRTAAEGTRADLPSDNCCNTKTQNLIVGVANRIMNVEDEVEELKNNPDVVDIVDTYQDLQNYDTSTLTDKDIIRVLQDSTHSGNSTYYRWNAATNQFNFVGEVAGGDTVYSDKTTSSSNTGGAVYIGNLNASQAEQADPTTTDNHYKYFWALPSGNSIIPTNNSVNILGDVKSSAYDSIAIGNGAVKGATVYGGRSIAIGSNAESGQGSVALGNTANAGTTGANRGSMIAIGGGAQADVDKAICIGGGGSIYGVQNSASTSSVALGHHATVGDGANGYKNSVALGAYSKATRQGEVNVGLVTDETTGGYNDTAYRVIGGVHDPVDAHDAATKGYVDANAGGSLTYFTSVSPDSITTGVTLYSDSAHTTPISLATFFSALRNGKTVWLEYRNGEGEEDGRERDQIVSAFLTNVDTENAYNEVMPSATYYSTSGKRLLQPFSLNPTDTTNAFSIGQ